MEIILIILGSIYYASWKAERKEKQRLLQIQKDKEERDKKLAELFDEKNELSVSEFYKLKMDLQEAGIDTTNMKIF